MNTLVSILAFPFDLRCESVTYYLQLYISSTLSVCFYYGVLLISIKHNPFIGVGQLLVCLDMQLHHHMTLPYVTTDVLW